MAEIDNLEISISARTATASHAIDKLIKNLGDLNVKLASINGNSLISFSDGIGKLTASMQNLSSVKTQDFTRLAKNIEKLGTINFANLDMVANGIRQVTSAFAGLSGVSSQSDNVVQLATAVSRLGYKSVGTAIDNLRRLGPALRDCFASIATIPAINQSVINMTNALANLANQGNRISTATNSLNRSLTSTTSVLNRTSASTFSLAAAFGKFYATYFLLIRGLKGVWKSIETSMDYVETFNYFDVTMQKMGKDFARKMGDYGEEGAEEFTEQFESTLKDLNNKMSGYMADEYGAILQSGMKNLNLDPNQLMQYEARIGAITNSVGMLGNASNATQQALTMLSADLSSLTNTDLSDVMDNLASGLVGQSKALYKYGIDITATSLAQVALAHNVTKSVSAMTQQEKMQLRVLAILEQSEISWGDQANTINSVANQYRIMQQQLQNLGRVIGNLFIPILQSVIPVVNGVIIALNDLFTMLGFEIWGDTWLDDIMDGVSGAVESVDDFDDDIKGLESDIDGATASAKKFKQQLQGFDELNNLTSNQGNGSGSGNLGEPLKLEGDIEDALERYKKVWNAAFDGMQNRAQEFAEMIGKLLEPVKQIIKDLSVGDFFKAGQDLSGMISKIFDFMAETIDKVDWEGIGSKIAEFLEGIDWNRLLKSVGKLIVEALKASIELWLGSFKTDPFGTLTLTFGAIAWKLGAFALTKDALMATLVKELPFLTSGTLSLGSIALLITIDTILVKWAWGIGTDIWNSFWEQSEEEGKSVFRKGFENLLKDIQSGDYRIQLPFDIQLPSRNMVDEWLSGAFNSITKWCNDTKTKFIDWSQEVGVAIGAGLSDVLADITMWTIDSSMNLIKWAENADKPIKDWALNVDNWLSQTFNKENFKKMMGDMKSGITDGWNDFLAWWDKSALSKWWHDDVTPWFNIDKWKTLALKIGEGIKIAWAIFKIDWENDGVKGIYERAKQWFSVEKWKEYGSDIVRGLLDGFNSIIDTLKDAFTRFADWVREKLTFNLDFGLSSSKGGFGLTSILGFAHGGITSADLFFANENGVPELIGTMGGKTAIASGTEVTGISDAVYETGETQASLLSTAVGLLQIIANNGNGVSDDYIFNSFRRSATAYTNRTGNPAIPI